ncbi:MAG: ATP-dependent Clp protease proteolytic subunit [Oscillospiraceae bacterium]|nr:ATP-dependent Clp protease proteolytic subunit [Oscillospiraceae bacterium]
MNDIGMLCEAPAYLYNGSKGVATVPLSSDFLSSGTVFIDEPITADSANKFLREMMYLSRRNEPVRLIINCPGGEVNAGLLMYDVINGFSAPLDVYCAGQAASMAAVLFAAGKPSHRFILPHSRVMIHEVLAGGNISGSATSISKISRSIMEVRDLVNSILAAHTGKTVEQINTATSFDNIMNAKEAVEFGIADKIVTSVSF